MTLQRILLTGAAGRIGTAFYQTCGANYHVRLADRVVEPLVGNLVSDDVVQFDVADLDDCYRVCQDIDTVVHLAGDASPDADFYHSLLESNIKGAYNIFCAAKDQGCRRVVFASRAQAVEGYPLEVQVRADMPVRPKNMYGVTKCFGEALASYFAFTKGLSSIAVRIGNLAEFEAGQDHTARDISAFISERDLVHLLVQCVETPDIQFAIVHGVSNNRFKRLDLVTTRQQLGYAPQDDGFAVLQIGLHD